MTEDGEPTHIDTLQKYKLRLEKKRDVYHTRYKYDKEFINKNRERARSHYHRNKEKQQALKLYRYYLREKTKQEFIDCHPEKFIMISDRFTEDEIDALI